MVVVHGLYNEKNSVLAVHFRCSLQSIGLCSQCYSNAPINVLPHLPQVRPSRGHGRGLVSRFCPEGWGFCITSVF